MDQRIHEWINWQKEASHNENHLYQSVSLKVAHFQNGKIYA